MSFIAIFRNFFNFFFLSRSFTNSHALAAVSQDPDNLISGPHKHSCKFLNQVCPKYGPRIMLAYQILSFTSLRHLTNYFKRNKEANLDLIYKYGIEKSIKAAWPSLALVLLVAKHIRRINDLDDRKKLFSHETNRALIIEALTLYSLVENTFWKERESLKLSLKHKRLCFKYIYQLLWSLEHMPEAKSISMLVDSKFHVNGKFYGIGLGAFGGLLSHSCEPTLRRTFNPTNGRLVYLATRDLSPGATLSLRWGVPARYRNVFNEFNEFCNCENCVENFRPKMENQPINFRARGGRSKRQNPRPNYSNRGNRGKRGRGAQNRGQRGRKRAQKSRK